MEDTDLKWRKASYSSNGGGNCVEVGEARRGVLVRDTKNRAGVVLRFTPAAWRRFAGSSEGLVSWPAAELVGASLCVRVPLRRVRGLLPARLVRASAGVSAVWRAGFPPRLAVSWSGRCGEVLAACAVHFPRSLARCVAFAWGGRNGGLWGKTWNRAVVFRGRGGSGFSPSAFPDWSPSCLFTRLAEPSVPTSPSCSMRG